MRCYGTSDLDGEINHFQMHNSSRNEVSYVDLNTIFGTLKSFALLISLSGLSKFSRIGVQKNPLAYQL